MTAYTQPPRVLAPPLNMAQWMRWVEGNVSTQANQSPAKVAVTANDLGGNAVTFGAMAPGALDTFLITSPNIQSSIPGGGIPRWAGDNLGIHFYDALGNTTIDLNAATGQALITGALQTALPGVYPRSVFQDTGISYDRLPTDPSWPNRLGTQLVGNTYTTGPTDEYSFIGVRRNESWASGVDYPYNTFVINNTNPISTAYTEMAIQSNRVQIQGFNDNTGNQYPGVLAVGYENVSLGAGGPSDGSVSVGFVKLTPSGLQLYTGVPGGGIATTDMPVYIYCGNATGIGNGLVVRNNLVESQLALQADSTLAVAGISSLHAVAITGSATISTTLAVTGATTLNGGLAVTGAATVSSTLTVAGVTNLNGGVAVTGAISVSGTSTLTGAVTTGSTLSVGTNLGVAGTAYFTGSLTAAAAVAMYGTTQRITGGLIATWKNDGTNSSITDNTSVDTIIVIATTAYNANGTGINCNLDIGYRVTYDRVVDIYLRATFASAPAAGLGSAATFTNCIPAAIRTDAFGIGNTRARALAHGNANVAGVTSYLLGGASWVLRPPWPGSATVYEASFVYTIPKP